MCTLNALIYSTHRFFTANTIHELSRAFSRFTNQTRLPERFALEANRNSNARGVLFPSCKRAPSGTKIGWGQFSSRIGITTPGAAAERNRKRVQESAPRRTAPVEWDIWSHRAIQQSLASAAHTNGWYRAATLSRTAFLPPSFPPIPRQDVNQWDARKRRIHALRSARIPLLFLGFIFPSILLARISPEYLSRSLPSSRPEFLGLSSS